jgi:hypothetical protein
MSLYDEIYQILPRIFERLHRVQKVSTLASLILFNVRNDCTVAKLFFLSSCSRYDNFTATLSFFLTKLKSKKSMPGSKGGICMILSGYIAENYWK